MNKSIYVRFAVKLNTRDIYFQESPDFIDDYKKPELEQYEKVTPTPKDKRRPSENQVD